MNLRTCYFFRLTILVCLLYQLSACKTQNLFQSEKKNAAGSFSLSSNNYQYRIRTDDKISISFWDHDELSVGSLYGIYNSNEVYGKWVKVDERGEINFPKIGAFYIKGMTIVQAQDSLTKIFTAWIKNPVIELKVLNQEITVLGEVKNPGNLLLEKEHNTLVEMIGKAGDFDFYANKKEIKIIRANNNNDVKEVVVDLTKMYNYRAANILLIPGDVVIVPSKKGKEFDKRASVIIPFVSIITALVLTYKAFF